MYDDETYQAQHRDDATGHDKEHYTLPTAGDSTKKAAPVDTVRLKKDMNEDYKAGSTLFNAASEAPGYLNNALKNLSNTAAKDVDRGSDALLERGKARSDSLEQARKGKIPATAGKTK